MKKVHIKAFKAPINPKKHITKKFFIQTKSKKDRHNPKTKKVLSKLIYIIGLIIIFFLYKFFFKRKSMQIKREEFKLNAIRDTNYNDKDNPLINRTIEKDINEEYKDIQDYMDCVMNGTEFYKNKIYYPSDNPKISIVISVYNGEPYLKTSILSVQNQDFKDIEIVIVDDCSQDNSVKLIKEIMKTEPRIVLFENKENKGALYTKAIGILHSKGKYLMTLDEDDIYVQKDAFSILYAEAERNDLDMLGFIAVHSGTPITRNRPSYYGKYRIITQPELSNLMYSIYPYGRVVQFGGNLWNLFIRTDLCKKAVLKIDEKNLNVKMNRHDDLIIFFLMTRIGRNIKYINRLFYVLYHSWNKNDKIEFRMNKKFSNEFNNRCFAFLNYLEILFKNTQNTIEDKKIAFYELEHLILDNKCRNNKNITQKATEICKLYLDNEYVSKEGKNKIQRFINSIPSNLN